MPTANVVLSGLIGAEVKARNRECFNNALRAVMRSRHFTKRHTLFYVEGWVVSSFGMVVRHAWVEYKDEVIDPTPAYVERPAKGYFPARRFTFKECAKYVEKDKLLPWTGQAGDEWNNPAVRNAYRAAVHFIHADDIADFLLQQLNQAFPQDSTEFAK